MCTKGDLEKSRGRVPVPIMDRDHAFQQAKHQVQTSSVVCR